MEYRKHRIFGYSLAIFMHMANMLYMGTYISPRVYDNPKLMKFKNLQPRFFTIWTLILQLIYSAVSLICELMLENTTNRKNTIRYVNGFRNVLFSSILWPSCWVVAIVFWSLCLYDKDLIFPEQTAELLHPISNHIMHTLIVPISVWEVVYRPRRLPRSHRKNVYHLLFYFAFYFIVMIYTYIESGLWIYPIFAKLYGTIFFPLIHLTMAGIAIVAYVIQWPLAEYVWRQNIKKAI
ncbi:androgen-dependent TFPI-regulating protein-like [Pieris napi]|uniref:androgen-dependent TFPI-regulating protein-like n=1 Tax=Pieris napi TaxID=78633 RepID=UPI001FB8A0CF|nr:androgen-dependent TFPI-regulating protein-like [Pieris napi]XP_047513824.1 androgen-dependent TFPI-regulating protein-like [Pieris napi]